mgnify:CR=1 FL=1
MIDFANNSFNQSDPSINFKAEFKVLDATNLPFEVFYIFFLQEFLFISI